LLPAQKRIKRKERMSDFSLYAQRLTGQPMFRIAEKVTSNHTRFDIGDPDFQTPKAIKEATIDAITRGLTHYTVSSGSLLLKQFISRFTHLHGAGFNPDTDQIVIAPGCNPLVYCLFRCLVKEGEAVALPDPGFPTYRSVADFLNIETVSLPLLEENGFNINPEDIKNLPKNVKIVVTNSPNNPTGSMMSEKDAKDIFNYCNKSNRYLISDEIYHLMSYGNEHFSPCIDKCKTNTIMLNGFSKSFAMSGYRLGYMISSTDIAEKVSLLLQTTVSCTSEFIQMAGCEAYDRIPGDIGRNMSVLADRRRVLVGCLNDIEGITCAEPKGAFYVFPNITGTGLTSQEFTDLMFKHCVAVVPGTAFGRYGEGYVRLAFTQSTVNARIGVHRIETALTGSSEMIKKTGRWDV